MKSFKSKYNYLILFLRVAGLIFFAFLFTFSLKMTPELLEAEKYSFKSIFGMGAFLFGMGFLGYLFGKLVFIQRIILHIENHNLKIIYAITRTKKDLKAKDIKGFSVSVYPIKVWNFKSIILYFENGQKAELPQFLYFNFKKIPEALESLDIKNFGHEPFRWKGLDSRHYKY